MSEAPARRPFGQPYQAEIRNRAIEIGCTKSELAVLNVLLSHCNGTSGQARPGRARIMEMSAIRSDRTLDKALQGLRARGLIVAVAYPRGGRGRATVYGFCLPAWSGQGPQETPANNAGETDELNPRNFCTKPPQNFPKTPAKFAGPTERTDRTGNVEPASRRQGDKLSDERKRELEQFCRWTKQYGYARARQLEAEAKALAMAAE